MQNEMASDASITPSNRYYQLIVTALLGALAHTGVCWIALQLDFFRGSSEVFNQVFSAIWVGHLILVGTILVGLNRRFRDPSMSVPIILWSTLSLLLTAYYVDQVRLCVMVLFFAILQTGVFRLRFMSFVAISTLCVSVYAFIIWMVAERHPEAIDVTAEVIQWAAFTMITVGAVMVAGEISSIRVQLAQRNTQLETIVDRIQDMAIRDELTGLYSRRHAMELLAKACGQARRGAFLLAVGFVDLDHFKRINDRHGHLFGDQVLVRFAELTRRYLGDKDMAARLGGEEFLIMLPVMDMEQALTSVERLMSALRAQRFMAAPALEVTASVGLTVVGHGESPDEVLVRADRLLYQAKAAGRDRIITAGPP